MSRKYNLLIQFSYTGFSKLTKSSIFTLSRLNMSKKKKIQPENKIVAEIESPVTTEMKTKNILISILAKPGAKQNAIVDYSSEGVSVQINAPPKDGEANKELVKYMVSVLNLKKNEVTLDKGMKSKVKILRITGDVSVSDVTNRIKEEVEKCK